MSSDDNPSRLQALLAEQAALRGVATMVAGGTPAPALFGRVCEELGELLEVRTTDMLRYEEEGFATLVGYWTGMTRRTSHSASAFRSRGRRALAGARRWRAPLREMAERLVGL